MSSGLTRRRGGGGGTASGENSSSRVASPVPKAGSSRDQPETSYESGENGHKIAFDPRDMNESAERSKQPKLTMMEEVLLLGLKDKQVNAIPGAHQADEFLLTILDYRAICPSGTITYHMRFEDVSSSSWLSEVV
jgi:hypothetical protein